MTKKLRLSLDSLEVESFAAIPEGNRHGTVAGYGTNNDSCAPESCDPSLYETCTYCGGTCVGCATNNGPNCATQKLTYPCGNC